MNDHGRNIAYDRLRARDLLPLLGAIGREIEERSKELARIEALIAEQNRTPYSDTNTTRSLVAEAAAHRRGLLCARRELERLGCSVVGTEPLTFRIPGRVGEAKKSFVWQTGDPILK